MGALSRLSILLAAALLVWAAVAWPAAAQEPPITAEVNYSRLSIDEVLTLTVTVVGGVNLPDPELPAMDWAEVVSRSPAAQITIRNNVISSREVNHYRLRPTRVGKHTIGPISAVIGGQVYETTPIEVEITQAGPSRQSLRPTPSPMGFPTWPSGGDQAAFVVEAAVDDDTPYLGEQVTYTVRFRSAEVIPSRPSYIRPEFTGFWHRQHSVQREYRETISERRYRVAEVDTLLFPAVTGAVTIDPASIFVPGRELSSNTIDLEVKPLPGGAPDGFDGAVGDYSIAARVSGGGWRLGGDDGREGRVDEPLTLVLIIAGRGNVETLPDPEFPEMPGWRSFDGDSQVNTQITDGELLGSRVVERVYIPTAPGQFTIPAIPYTFFEPEAGEYRTELTEPISLTVTGTASQQLDPLQLSDRDAAARVDADIGRIKPAPDELRASGTPLTDSAAFRLGWVLPLLALAIGGGLKLHLDRRGRDPAEARRRAAYPTAMDSLSRAGGDDVGAILTSYLGDVLDQPVSGMIHAALGELLAERGADDALVERTLDALAAAEGARFAPGAFGGPAAGDALDATRRLVEDLEMEINS